MSTYKRRDYSKAMKPRQVAAAIAADLAASPAVAAAMLGVDAPAAPFEFQRAPMGVAPAASLVFQVPEDELTDSDVKDEQMLRDLETKKGYVKIHADCRNWVRLKPTEKMDKGTRLAFEPLWRLHFARFNGVEAAGLSYTDIGFRALCWAMVAEEPALRGAADLQSIRLVFLLTAIFSCQHTKESRSDWPDFRQWNEYKRTVASLATSFFTGSQVQRAALTAKLDDPDFQFDPVEAELLDQYDRMHVPPELAALHQEEERVAEAKRKAGKDDGGRVETSEEASGYIWRSTTDAIVDHLMVRAARLIYRVDFDHHLFDVYRRSGGAQGLKLPRFTPATLDGVRAWVRKKCAVEQPEEVTALFRELVCQWLLPLGADTARSRNKKSAHDVTTSLQMLEKEIGADLSQFHYDQTIKLRLHVIADAPDNRLLWDALFLALFEFDMRQRVHFEWMKDYFTSTPHLPHTQRRMAHPRFHNDPDKCPMVVEATRAYQVFYRQQLVGPADSLVHAVLSWLYFMGRDFTKHKGKSGRRAILLENMEDITAIHDTFLQRDSVVAARA